MKHLKAKESFLFYNNFAIDRNANIYLMRDAISIDNEIIEKEIIVYNSELEEINSFSYREVSDYLMTTQNQDCFSRFYVTHDNLFIIGTKQNRVFVLNFDGLVLNTFYEKDETIIGKLHGQGQFIAQKNHFAEGFFDTKDNKILTLTYGYGFGGINERGRFIIGTSKEKNPSFLGTEPFATIYINDIWHNLNKITPIWTKNMDVSNVKHPNIWHEIDEFKKYEYSLLNLYPNNYKEVSKNLKTHKLANPSRDYVQTHNLKIHQVIDLNENHILVSIFSDMQSKSSLPDKSTGYYLLILNKNTGEIVKDISPNDTTIYKNFPMFIVDDKINERLIFKTAENIFLINYLGEIYYQLSLTDRKFAPFRNWSFIGLENGISFFYDNKKNMIYNTVLGKLSSEIEVDILNLINDTKKIK